MSRTIFWGLRPIMIFELRFFRHIACCCFIRNLHRTGWPNNTPDKTSHLLCSVRESVRARTSLVGRIGSGVPFPMTMGDPKPRYWLVPTASFQKNPPRGSASGSRRGAYDSGGFVYGRWFDHWPSYNCCSVANIIGWLETCSRKM